MKTRLRAVRGHGAPLRRTSASPRSQVAHRAPSIGGGGPVLRSANDLLALQRTIGNAASGQLLQRKPFTTPKVVVIKGESVRVASDEQEAEAKALIKKFRESYGIKLSSKTTIAAIKKEYGDVPAKEKAKLKTSTWEMKELRAVDAALGHFAQILGKNRKKSTLAKKSQGVTTLGRVEEALNEDTEEGKVEAGTMGEYFSSKKNVGLFDTVTNLSDSRYIREGEAKKDNATTLEANAIHEMSHGLVEPIYLQSWIDTLDFWEDEDNASGKDGAEEPPTQYGHTAPGEDLAESVAIFFVNRPDLKARCPEREKFLAEMVAKWKPAEKAKVKAKAKTTKGSDH